MNKTRMHTCIGTCTAALFCFGRHNEWMNTYMLVWVEETVLAVSVGTNIRWPWMSPLYLAQNDNNTLLKLDCVRWLKCSCLIPQNGKSIMVEVATGGGEYILPMVLKVPYIVHTAYPECQPRQSFSLLGQWVCQRWLLWLSGLQHHTAAVCVSTPPVCSGTIGHSVPSLTSDIIPGVSKKSDEFILQLVDRKQNPVKWNAHEENRNCIDIFITPNSFSCNHEIVVSRRKNKTCAILLLSKVGHFDTTGIPYFFMVQKITSWNIILNIVRNFLAQENVYYKYRGISVANTTKGPQRTSLAWELRFSGALTSRCADSVKKWVAARGVNRSPNFWRSKNSPSPIWTLDKLSKFSWTIFGQVIRKILNGRRIA